MGVRSVFGTDPLLVAHAAVVNGEDVHRRKQAERRVMLYHDNARRIIEREIDATFDDAAVKQRVKKFVGMACSMSIFKRVVDEVSRPVYGAGPPVRKISSDRDAAAFKELARESRLDDKYDLGCRLTNAANDILFFYRVSDRLGFLVDVLAPHQFSVVPEPDDPGRELGVIYDKEVLNPQTQRMETVHVFWDDEETFTFRKNKEIVPVPLPGGKYGARIQHGLGRLPFVAAHRRERMCGHYYDTTTGGDLEAAQVAVTLLTTLVLRLHKTQGHKQLVISGDIAGTPTNQTIDEENGLVLPDGTSIQTLDLDTNAKHYTDTIELITEKVAANHGVNRDRLNQKTSTPSDDAGLFERRADAIKVFERVERDGFEVMKLVSRQHSDESKRLSESATLEGVDFGEFEYRVDPAAQVDLWDKMRSMGLRTVLDDIRALNPELQTDQEAESKLERNLEINSKWVERMRALNMAKNPQTGEPGQNAEDNGAMGPAVRDGKMSKDAASEQARGAKHGGSNAAASTEPDDA